MKRNVFLCLVVLVCFAPALRGLELVYLSSDESGASCDLQLSVGETASFYVLGWTDYPYGVVGAELRVVGVPESWVVSVTPNPLSTVTFGAPLAEGANIAFPSAAGYGHSVLLYTVVIVPTTEESELEFATTHHIQPANPNFICPRLYYDCGSCDLWVCSEGRSLYVNSAQGCLVSLAESTWAGVKELYR